LQLLEGKKPKTVAAASIFTAFFMTNSEKGAEEIARLIEETMGTKQKTLEETYK